MEEKVFERCDDDVGDKKFRVSDAFLLEGWESVSSFISFFWAPSLRGKCLFFPFFGGASLRGQCFFLLFLGPSMWHCCSTFADRIWGFVLYLAQCRRTSRQRRRSTTERKMT